MITRDTTKIILQAQKIIQKAEEPLRTQSSAFVLDTTRLTNILQLSMLDLFMYTISRQSHRFGCGYHMGVGGGTDAGHLHPSTQILNVGYI